MYGWRMILEKVKKWWYHGASSGPYASLCVEAQFLGAILSIAVVWIMHLQS